MTGTARVAKRRRMATNSCCGGVDTFCDESWLYKKLPYDAAADFVPVGLVIEQPLVLIARQRPGRRTRVPEFIAYGEGQQGQDADTHRPEAVGLPLTCARMNAAMGIDAAQIPYRGSAQGAAGPHSRRID